MSAPEKSDVKVRKTAVAKPYRKKRELKAPKGPGNAFFTYCRMERVALRGKKGNENLGEETRVLGHRWKALSEEEREKYYEAYKNELDAYKVAMKRYVAAKSALEDIVTEDELEDIVTEDELEEVAAQRNETSEEHTTPLKHESSS
ncbi:hypothetical protein K501DRAFT_216310 [Backusella circina FSU 941]|nr:hypothetical protein K501DRAFT_216310 [Backusella circina FSU 941]